MTLWRSARERRIREHVARTLRLRRLARDNEIHMRAFELIGEGWQPAAAYERATDEVVRKGTSR